MRKSPKSTATIIPFPSHLVGLPRGDEGPTGRLIRRGKGRVELFAGDNGMVSLDALVPLAVAVRMLAAMNRPTA
jgi:hypothetical protein